MSLGQLARDGQAEAGAFWAAGDEGLEQALGHVRGHTGAGVLDRQDEETRTMLDTQRDGASVRCMTDRVCQQIVQHPSDHGGVKCFRALGVANRNCERLGCRRARSDGTKRGVGFR